MENAINISRLLDNGIYSTEDNIHKEVKGFGFLSDVSNFQKTFIRPVAVRAIESFWGNTN